MMSMFWRDVVLGVRAHMRTPAMTAIAVAVLSVGIAAAGVSISIADAFFVRQLPIAESGRFVHVYRLSEAGEPFPISFPLYEDVRGLTQVFDGAAAEAPAPLILGASSGAPERVWGEVVSDDYFRQLGIQAVHGRLFSGPEDAVVLSEGWWRRRFGGDPDVLTRTLEIEGRPYRVVGIAPEEFHGTIVGFFADLWIPLAAGSSRTANSPMRDDAEHRDEHNYFVMARLAPGVGLEQARGALQTLAGRVDEEHPSTDGGIRLTALTQSQGRFPTMRDRVFGSSMLLVAIGILVTLIACANIAGVLLVRAAARRSEIAVRLALGASRLRIVSQLLAESASLAIVAGLAGIGLAWQATALLSGFRVSIARGATAGVDVTLDARVLAISALLIVVTGVLSGLTPALESAKTDLLDGLRAGAKGRIAGRSRSRSLLLVAQIAVSMVLLGVGGLFLRSFQSARQIDLGFNPDRVTTVAVDIRVHGDPAGPDDPFWRRLLDDVRALPDTEAAGLTWRLPLELGITRLAMAPASFVPAAGRDWPETEFSTISSGYFATLGIPLVDGRDFDDRDAGGGSQPVVIVNDVIAARYWPGQRAVGQIVKTSEGERYQVVGVVRRSKYITIGEPPTPYAYFAVRQNRPRAMTIVARSASGRPRHGDEIRAVAKRLDQQATIDVARLEDRVRVALAPAAGGASAMGLVTLLALALTALGLFGAVAQTVGRRTYEIGVRRALGAPDWSVAALVASETLVLVAWGLGIGTVAALAASRPMEWLLYDVDVADPLVFGMAPIALATVCLLAICLPTWRALRINAAVALRQE